MIEAGCSYDARQLEGNDGARFRISCPAACDKSSSSTYGTGVYTGDSPVCKAGIHAGAIPREGGVFTIQLEAGRPAYRGGMQNGIESQDYGKYSRSYSVVSSNAASPPAGGTPQAAAAPATGTSAAVPGGEVIEAGCSYDARQLDAKDGTRFRISCPAGCEKSSSSTYGTGVYTGDSPVCKAGIHAGAIPREGGVFTIQLEAGRPAYRGGTQNGIESQDYGKYSRSYSVVSSNTASPPAGGTPQAAAAAAASAAAPGGEVIEAGCSYDARQLDAKDGTTFRISCPADCEKSSSTYGTGVYTGDSPVCKAGIHAGAIPLAGGVFTIQLQAGRPAYRGSTQNGIESQDYGKYSRSYSVVLPK